MGHVHVALPRFVDAPFEIACSDSDPDHDLYRGWEQRTRWWAHRSRCPGPFMPSEGNSGMMTCERCQTEIEERP